MSKNVPKISYQMGLDGNGCITAAAMAAPNGSSEPLSVSTADRPRNAGSEKAPFFRAPSIVDLDI